MPSNLQERRRVVLIISLLIAAAGSPALGQGANGAYPEAYYRKPEPSVVRSFNMQRKEMDALPPEDGPALGASPCVGGSAAGYPCRDIDLLAYLPLADIGGGQTGNDVWGWTDPQNGREYAIVGRSNGTAFVDITDPENPVYLGNLATQSFVDPWRDIKVFNDHAFIVSEANNHGMQVFDLAELRAVPVPPVTFLSAAFYFDFRTAHNIVINEDSGFAYAVGSDTCAGGLHVINIQNPTSPTFAGCVADDGYVHDAQCVIYTGPDADYSGREICFNYNEDTLTIVDVTDKAAPLEISRTSYVGVRYTHQGWLTEDQGWALMNDEVDEYRNLPDPTPTRTLVWDLRDLDVPVHAFSHDHETHVTDHNLYTKGNFVYESNYQAGLRILDLACMAGEGLVEVGYFDIYLDGDEPGINGAWSSYPYYDSGVVVVSGREQGLFVLRPNVQPAPPVPPNYTAIDTGANRIELDWDDMPGVASYLVTRSDDGCNGPFVDYASTVLSEYSDTGVSALTTYGYRVRAESPLGCVSSCIEVEATGDCYVAPTFGGVGAIRNTFGGGCSLELSWQPATSNCGDGDVLYNVYRDTAPGFLPDGANRVQSCVAGTSWVDGDVAGSDRYYYVVRAEDVTAVGSGPCGGVEEENQLEATSAVVSDSIREELFDGAEGALEVSLEPPWIVSTDDAQSGISSFHLAVDEADICASITLPPVVPTATSLLTFAHREEDLDLDWNGGTIELSADGGDSWERLTPTPDYPHTLVAHVQTCTKLEPAPYGCYSGDSGGFASATVDLSPWTGQEIRVRLRFGKYVFWGGGWWLDDVRVTDLAVGLCSASWRLYRSSVDDVSQPSWKSGVPLPLLATSNIDTDWPRPVTNSFTELDSGAIFTADPLVLYRVLDDARVPVENRLKLARDGNDISVVY